MPGFPLNRVTVPLSFSGGIDTKTDPLQLDSAKVAALTNASFDRPRRISLRTGSERVMTLAAPRGLATFNGASSTTEQELIGMDGAFVYSLLDSGSQEAIPKGALVSAFVTRQNIRQSSSNQSQQTGASDVSGSQIYAWVDSIAGLQYSIVGSTGQTVVPATTLALHGRKPCAFAWNNNFSILYYDTSLNQLMAVTVPVVTLTAFPATYALTSLSGSSQINATRPTWDATLMTDGASVERLYLTFYGASGDLLVFAYGPANGFLAPQYALDTPGVNIVDVGSLLTNAPGNVSLVFVAWDGFSTETFSCYTYDAALTAVAVETTVDTLANVVNIVGVADVTVNNTAPFYVGVSAVSDFNRLTQQMNAVGASSGFFSVFKRSVSPFAKAFIYEGNVYIPLAYSSDTEPSYFIVDQNGSLNSNPIPMKSGNVQEFFSAEVANPSAGVYRIACQYKDQVASSGGNIFTQTGIATITLNFTTPDFTYLHAEMGGSLLLSGGMPRMYDGARVVEHGFPIYPDALTVSHPGENLAFVYKYAAIYFWYDNQGLIHLSSPSIPVSQTQTNAIDGAHGVTVRIPTLRLTDKTNVMIGLYRTKAGVNEYFLVYAAVGDSNSPPNPIQNDTSVDYVTYTDTVIDDDLTGNPPIYTTSGVLENIEPGPISAMCVHQNRVFAIPSADPLRILVSQQVVPGSTPVEFSADSLYIIMDPRGGPCIVPAEMDEKLVVFKQDSIFIIQGTGPSATGVDNQFQPAYPLPSEVGCVNPKSVALSDDGLFFQSRKGIMLLTRGLQIDTHVGAPVYDYVKDSLVTSVTQLNNLNQIRFTMDSGVTLVWDDFVKQWSVNDPMDAADSCNWQGLFTWLRTDGGIFQETPDLYVDPDGQFIPLSVKTAWLWLDGLQGFGRFYEGLILGSYTGTNAPSLKVSISYMVNNIPTISQEIPIVPVQPNTYGGVGPYGMGDSGPEGTGVYGGDTPLYQFRFFPRIQQCQAVQLTIESVYNGAVGQGLSLSSLNLTIGARTGKAWTKPAGASYG